MFSSHMHEELRTPALAISQAQAICQKYLCLHPTREKKHMLCQSSKQQSSKRNRGPIAPDAAMLEKIVTVGSPRLVFVALVK